MSPGASAVALTSPTIAGIGGVHGGAIPTEHGLSVLGGERFSGLGVGDDHPAFELPGDDPHVGQPIPVAGVHPGLHLEDDRTERVGHFAQPAVDVRASGGGGGEFHQRLEQLPHPEVEHRRREDHRRGLPGQEHLLVVVLAHLGEQFALLGRGHPRVALPLGGDVGAHDLLGRDLGAARGPGEVHVLAGASVEQSAEVAGDADGHEQRGGGQADTFADLVDQFERGAARPVPFVDDGDHGDAAVPAHLEQFEGLRLETLRGVDEHHRGIDGGEDAVGVLGEVGVAGGVDEVDDVRQLRVVGPGGGRTLGCVVELQRRRADRDPACLLHLHPVGDGGFASGLAVDGAGLADHARVQRQRLGHRRLTRVRVGDDREGAAPSYFGCDVRTHPSRLSVEVAAAKTLGFSSGIDDRSLLLNEDHSNGTGGILTTCAAYESPAP